MADNPEDDTGAAKIDVKDASTNGEAAERNQESYNSDIKEDNVNDGSEEKNESAVKEEVMDTNDYLNNADVDESMPGCSKDATSSIDASAEVTFVADKSFVGLTAEMQREKEEVNQQIAEEEQQKRKELMDAAEGADQQQNYNQLQFLLEKSTLYTDYLLDRMKIRQTKQKVKADKKAKAAAATATEDSKSRKGTRRSSRRSDEKTNVAPPPPSKDAPEDDEVDPTEAEIQLGQVVAVFNLPPPETAAGGYGKRGVKPPVFWPAVVCKDPETSVVVRIVRNAVSDQPKKKRGRPRKSSFPSSEGETNDMENKENEASDREKVDATSATEKEDVASGREIDDASGKEPDNASALSNETFLRFFDKRKPQFVPNCHIQPLAEGLKLRVENPIRWNTWAKNFLQWKDVVAMAETCVNASIKEKMKLVGDDSYSGMNE